MGYLEIAYKVLTEKGEEIKRLCQQVPYYPFSLKFRMQKKLARQSFTDPLLFDYLKERYPKYNLLTCNNQIFPITVFEYLDGVDAEQNQLNVLGELLQDTPESPQINNWWYYCLIRSKTDSHNDDTFVMDSLTLTPRPLLKCKISNFFDVARSSLPLEWELLMAVSKARHEGYFSYQDMSQFTPLRNQLHKITNDPVVQGYGRAAAVGISTLLAYQTNDGIELLLRARGKRSTPPREYMYHVLPSSFFQSPFQDYTREYSLIHSCLWEYYEEFFDKKETKEKKEESTNFLKEEPVAILRQMLKDKNAELYVTGIAVDLLTLRPEILLLLYIKDKTWYDAQKFKMNPEHATSEELPTGEATVKRIILTRYQDIDGLFNYFKLTPAKIVPQGAAALALGAQKLLSLKIF